MGTRALREAASRCVRESPPGGTGAALWAVPVRHFRGPSSSARTDLIRAGFAHFRQPLPEIIRAWMWVSQMWLVWRTTTTRRCSRRSVFF
jgi:hypothetical protein